MRWNGANDPQDWEDEDEDAWDCETQGHVWQTLTRHADPPGYRGVLPNVICVHCSDLRWVDMAAAEQADERPFDRL